MLHSDDQQHREFIDNIIMTFCIGGVDLNDSFVVHDTNGKIIIASNKFAQSLGFKDWHAIKDKTDRELNIAPDNEKIYNEWDNLRQKVIQDKISIYYLNFLHFSYGFDAHANIIFPILTPNGEVAATRVFAKKFKWIRPIECFNNLLDDKDDKAIDDIVQKYMLTEQEYEIIFALYIGLSQEEAAIFLGMSRSNIAKILNGKIYPKFGIENKKIDTFIKVLYDNNVIITMPKQFASSRCIIIPDLDGAQSNV